MAVALSKKARVSPMEAQGSIFEQSVAFYKQASDISENSTEIFFDWGNALYR
jgi:hypothetical protein